MIAMMNSSVRSTFMRPTVSFIMGVYCCKNPKTLLASVESVVRQTFGDWEFLIVDDGSPDEGATYCAVQEAAALDDRVIALRYDQNKGLAFALNFCLERARGRYIARQDDDDFSVPMRLEKQVEFLETHPDVSLVGSNAVLFDNRGEWGEFKVPERPTRQNFLWNSPFIHPSIVVRADALRAVGGYRIAAETARCEDYDLFMRMYAAGMQGENIQAALYRYRSNRDTSKYRPMKHRFEEAIVRARGFKAMGIGPSRLPYIVKPLAVGLIPKGLYGAIQKGRTAS